MKKDKNKQKICYAILYEIYSRNKYSRESLMNNSVMKNSFVGDIEYFKQLVVSDEVSEQQVEKVNLNLYLILIEHISMYLLNARIQDISSVELALSKEFDKYQEHKQKGSGKYSFVSDIKFLESDLFSSKIEKYDFFLNLFREVYIFYREEREYFRKLEGNISKKKSYLRVVK